MCVLLLLLLLLLLIFLYYTYIFNAVLGFLCMTDLSKCWH